MGAAIGWLQGNSSRSKEGRVSWPKNWMAAANGDASGFPRIAGPLVLSQRMLGARRVPECFLVCQTPWTTARCSCRSATEHRNNNAHLVLRTIWKNELGSEKVTQKSKQTQSTIGEDARTIASTFRKEEHYVVRKEKHCSTHFWLAVLPFQGVEKHSQMLKLLFYNHEFVQKCAH